nr:hypothetical protein [Tanacetum cinerariifolium]
ITTPSPEKFFGEPSSQNQTCSPPPDLSDPIYHSPPLAATPLHPHSTVVVTTSTPQPTPHHHHRLPAATLPRTTITTIETPSSTTSPPSWLPSLHTTTYNTPMTAAALAVI